MEYAKSHLKHKVLQKLNQRFTNFIHALVWVNLIVLPETLFGHGEDQAGPHGGKIRMPNAFHTELVVSKNRDKALFYLLDVNFKTVSIKKSRFESTLLLPNSNPSSAANKTEESEIALSCIKLKDHFECKLPPSCSKAGSCNIKVFADINGDPKNTGSAEYIF